MANKFILSIEHKFSAQQVNLLKLQILNPNKDLISHLNNGNLNIYGVLTLTYIPIKKTTLAFSSVAGNENLNSVI